MKKFFATLFCAIYFPIFAQIPLTPIGNPSAANIDLLESVNGLTPNTTGIAVKEWKEKETRIKIVGDQYISIQTYEGEVLNGKAHGQGRLVFGGPWIPPMPGAIMGYSDIWPGFVYTGAFENGRPKGQGSLLNRPSQMSMKGEFSDLLAVSGPVTFSAFGKPVIYGTSKDGQLSDGPLKIFLYPNGGEFPSAVFLGSMNSGQQTGTWTALPWRIKNTLAEQFGYQDTTQFITPDGAKITCVGESFAPSKSGLISGLTGDMSDIFWPLDPRTMPSSAVCEQTGSDGYRYKYKADYSKRSLIPIACANAQGVTGSLTVINESNLQCTVQTVVVKKSNNLFAKVWREIERTPKNLEKIVWHNTDEFWGEFEEFTCGLGGKKPGKNCSVNMAVGVTIQMPGGEPPISGGSQNSSNDPARVASAKQATGRINDVVGTSPNKAWARDFADLYSLCVQTCSPEYSAYSMTRLQQIEFELGRSGTEADKYRRIASLGGDVSDILQKVASKIPVASYVYAYWRASKKLDRLDLAVDAINQLPPVDFTSKERYARVKAQTQFAKIGFQDVILNELAPEAFGVWKDTFMSVLPDLPGMSKYAQAKLLFDLGIDVTDFMKLHKKFNTSDEFIEAAINDKLAPLGAPWPPKTN